MKLTLIQPTDVPSSLRHRFGPYHVMLERTFADRGFTFETIKLSEGETLPDPALLDATLIMGSAAAVYDVHYDWMDPLREYIRAAYAAKTPMVGICFGHQIMAETLGGDVRKSNRGWGLGRHVYDLKSRPGIVANNRRRFAVACSHQDQVIVPPKESETFLSSTFTPHAGLVYHNGAAMSVQAHPEFEDDYALALIELRRGIAPDEVVEKAIDSLSRVSDSSEMATFVTAFLDQAHSHVRRQVSSSSPRKVEQSKV
ncbi:MAG TPA: hypothetical protein PKD55_17615 [Bellilinea sp.]|nr:hypothetical protein [Bellilinea sp.]